LLINLKSWSKNATHFEKSIFIAGSDVVKWSSRGPVDGVSTVMSNSVIKDVVWDFFARSVL